MSYTIARDLLRQAVLAVGEEPDVFGLQSLRPGRASTAAPSVTKIYKKTRGLED